MPTKPRKGKPVTTAVLARLVPESDAAAACARTVAEFQALTGRGVDVKGRNQFHKPMPQAVDVDGVPMYDVGPLRSWMVWAGFLTRDGRKLIGYPEIAAILGFSSEQSARALLRRRNEEVREHRKPRARDIPAPYGYFNAGPGGNPRPMWLEYDDPHDPKRRGIIDWAILWGRRDPVTGEPKHPTTGGTGRPRKRQ